MKNQIAEICDRLLMTIGVIFFIFCLALAALITLVKPADAQKPVTDPATLSRAIGWLIVEYDKTIDRTNPELVKRIVNRKTLYKERRRMAREYVAAGARFGVPPLVLVVRTFFESHWRKDIFNHTVKPKPKHGEEGIMQVVPMGRAWCTEHFDECVNMDTTEQQINCGGCWFAEGSRMCKHKIEKAFVAYAIGRCKTESPRIKWKMNEALKLLVRLRTMIEEGIL